LAAEAGWVVDESVAGAGSSVVSTGEAAASDRLDG